MKTRPILFSAPMVRALLDGTKSQTRRVVKLPKSMAGGDLSRAFPDKMFGVTPGLHIPMPDESVQRLRNPWGWPDPSRIWVREAWRIGAWDEDNGSVAIDYLADAHPRKEWITIPESHDPDGEVFKRLWEQSSDDAERAGIKADDSGRYQWEPGESPCRGRPSIFMPRWASRILLEIVSVRVERLQDISEADSLAEGITCENVIVGANCNGGHHSEEHSDRYFFGGRVDEGYELASDAYAALWESINGPGSWEANPFVWCVEFKWVEA